MGEIYKFNIECTNLYSTSEKSIIWNSFVILHKRDIPKEFRVSFKSIERNFTFKEFKIFENRQIHDRSTTIYNNKINYFVIILNVTYVWTFYWNNIDDKINIPPTIMKSTHNDLSEKYLNFYLVDEISILTTNF